MAWEERQDRWADEGSWQRHGRWAEEAEHEPAWQRQGRWWDTVGSGRAAGASGRTTPGTTPATGVGWEGAWRPDRWEEAWREEDAWRRPPHVRRRCGRTLVVYLELQPSTTPPRSFPYDPNAVLDWDVTDFCVKGKRLWWDFIIPTTRHSDSFRFPFELPFVYCFYKTLLSNHKVTMVALSLLCVGSARTWWVSVCTNCNSHPRVLLHPK